MIDVATSGMIDVVTSGMIDVATQLRKRTTRQQIIEGKR